MEPSLALLKKQVRADDFSKDDAYLEHLLDTAKEAVITATNRTEAELREMDSEGHLPKMLQQALMETALKLKNGESVAAVAMHEVPDSVQALVKPYRRLV